MCHNIYYMEEKNRNRTTSISVSPETGAALTKLCEKIGCPKNEFVAASVEYFAKHKLDPRTADRPTAREIDELKKRMDQFFAFLKNQEKELIVPMVKGNQELADGIKTVLIRQDKK